MQRTVSEIPWRNAVRSEMTFLLTPQYSGADFLETIDRLSPEQAKAFLDGIVKTFMLANGGDRWDEFESAISVWMTGFCVLAYPPAKQRLMQKGLTEEEIEALSTHQIIAPFVYEELRRAYDLMQVSVSLPLGESLAVFGNFDEYVMQIQRRNAHPVDMIVATFMPAASAAHAAYFRQTQTLDLLKIVEALRYYAAIHGKLPESLDEITELAVPKICPIWGNPYEYRVEGNTAIIDYSMHPRDTSRIEIVIEGVRR
jgi:hypothetical protein